MRHNIWNDILNMWMRKNQFCGLELRLYKNEDESI